MTADEICGHKRLNSYAWEVCQSSVGPRMMTGTQPSFVGGATSSHGGTFPGVFLPPPPGAPPAGHPLVVVRPAPVAVVNPPHRMAEGFEIWLNVHTQWRGLFK